MLNDTLNQNNERFQALTQLIWQHHQNQQKQSQVRPNLSPEDYQEQLSLSLEQRQSPLPDEALLQEIERIQALSVATSHPLFMNQLYGHIHDMGLLGDMLSSGLNTSMATYEIAPLLTLIEKEVIAQLAREIGFSQWDGLMTPGGSLSNLQAMLMAKDRRFPEARAQGVSCLPALRIFVSDQAHYSFLKFAQLLGLGQDAIVKVASQQRGAIDPAALKQAIESELAAGHVPLMIAATAGTTVSGVYDDLQALAQLAQHYQLWFHVDGSYGGSLLLSEATRPLLTGIEQADSVAWNPHKMLGVPFHCPALITRHKGALEASLSTDASYLFHDHETEFNLGQKSLHCGRRPEALKFWLSWQAYGRDGLSQRVAQMVTAARNFAQQVDAQTDCELLCPPEAPIVCFQYRPAGLKQEQVNALNQQIRERIFAEGKILLNYAHISGMTVLRCVISHPGFRPEHAQQILKAVRQTGQAILKAASD